MKSQHDVFALYHARVNRLAKIPPEVRAYYKGYISALAYVQAQSTPGDYPTVVVDVPDHDLWDSFQRSFDPQEFLDVLADMNDEGGILYVRFFMGGFVEEGANPALRLELASTETARGLPPDWDQRQSLADEIRKHRSGR